MSGRVLGSKGVEGGKERRESGRGGIRVRGDAGDPEGGQPHSLSAVGDYGGKAGFPGKDGGGGGRKVVCGPSVDPMPEAVHSSERRWVWGEQIGP